MWDWILFNSIVGQTPVDVMDQYDLIRKIGVFNYIGFFALISAIIYTIYKLRQFVKVVDAVKTSIEAEKEEENEDRKNFQKAIESIDRMLNDEPYRRCKISECPGMLMIQEGIKNLAEGHEKFSDEVSSIIGRIDTANSRVHERIDKTNEIMASIGQTVVASLRGIKNGKN